MAKEPAHRKALPTSPSKLKAQVDRMDRELVNLLNLRARVATELARQSGVIEAGKVPDEIERRIAEVLPLSKGPLSEECLRAVMREVLSGTLALERTRRVAFLGPAYSYSHIATLSRFGTAIEEVPVGSIGAAFEEVNRGHVDYGVVPVENTTDGRVADTLDMFTRLSVRICGEVPLRIHHNLLGRCARNEVTEVYSKPQAVSQCRNWLSKHLPGVRIIEVTSTSTAAQLAQDKPGAAAIASVEAGRHYGLSVLVPNIEDNVGNITRFAIIGDESAPRTGHDRMAAMFEVEHRPGGLAEALNVFRRYRLNMTWIESFPIARPEGGYMFFVELEGHETDARMRKGLDSLAKKALRLEVLGSFPHGQPVG